MIGEDLPGWARQLIPWLALGHGSFNLLVFGLFIRQGWLGLAIRRARRLGLPAPPEAVRRHRRSGPLVAALGGAGFLLGTLLVTADKGEPTAYPLHFAGGVMIVFVIFTLYTVAGQLKQGEVCGRTLHAVLGLLLLILYLCQALLGVGILL